MASQTGSIDLTASNSVKLAAEAGWQSDLEDYYTKSEIDVTVGGINSTVSTKVGEDEVISSINQSAESVSINANKINLTGAVTISDLASDAQNATLNSNIVGGGANLIGAFNLYVYINCKYDHSTGTMTSTTTTNTADNSVCLQFYNGGTYVSQYGSGFGASSVGELCGWTFDKTSEFDCIRLKFNGDKNDADCRWSISSVADGTTITLSFRLDSISSDGKGNGGVMSGINLRAGTLRSEWSLAPQDETVGGRNLFVDTDRYLTTFNGSAFGGENSPLRVIPAGETITISVEINADNLVWASSGQRRIGCETSITKTGGGNQYIGAWAGTSISQGSNIVEVLDGTMHKRISKTFVLLGDMAVGNNINLYTQGVASGTLSVGRVKVERGDTATDWSPAPEDVDSAISDAAKTATSYVTNIDSNGITVHPSRSDYATNGGRAVINGDGLTVYLGSDDVASYGASARIGKSNSDRVTVDSTNGITIYKGNSKRLQTTANGIDVYGSDGTTSVASFGSTTRLGSTSSGNYLVMNANGLNLYNELDGTNYSSRIGPSSVSLLGGNFYLESLINGGTASTFYDTVLSQIYSSSVRTSLTLRVTKDKNTSTTSRSIITNSPLSVTGRIDATSQITGTYQLVATGEMNEIALRANTSGNRGLYDLTNDEWILYRDGNNDNLVIKFLSSNFDIDAAVVLSGSTSISANGVQTGTTNITKSGWVPVAIAGVNVNTHWAATVRWYLSARGSGTGTISWAVHNMSGTAAITPTVTFYVLWARGD